MKRYHCKRLLMHILILLSLDLTPAYPEKGCAEGLVDYVCPNKLKNQRLSSVGRTNPIANRCRNTCLCEEHCAWDRCHLIQPPENCLIGTQSFWSWNSKKNYWVAKKFLGPGNIIQIRQLYNILSDHQIILRLMKDTHIQRFQLFFTGKPSNHSTTTTDSTTIHDRTNFAKIHKKEETGLKGMTRF